MKNRSETAKSGRRGSLTMRSIFRYMMEDGYYPVYEKSHILFDIGDNTAVVEYNEGILSIRLFFSIEEDAYDLFLEASNSSMLETFIVKPAILQDMKNIMFSFETICESKKDFRRFFSRGIEYLEESIRAHKSEMKKLVLAEEILTRTIPATDDISMTGINKSVKILS